MSEIFISYASSTAAEAQAVAEALRGLGYGVWRDDELPAHRSLCRCVDRASGCARPRPWCVIWSGGGGQVASGCRAGGQIQAPARKLASLVQLNLDGAKLPMPFDRIQCADLTGWTGDLDAHDWRKVVASVAEN